MAINARSPRSVSSIKTHSGRASGAGETHRDYFKVGALELERSRRVKERDAANDRITIINARIAEMVCESNIDIKIMNIVHNLRTSRNIGSIYMKQGFQCSRDVTNACLFSPYIRPYIHCGI
jgi:hypothetical protein